MPSGSTRTPVVGLRLLLLLAAYLSCTAESTGPAPAPVSPSEVRPEMVTGAAAAALGVDGFFALELPEAGSGEVSLDTARAQALEFAKYVTNNVLLRGVVEAGRGGYWTDPHLLVRCGRDAGYVRPQLEAMQLDSLPVIGRTQLLRKFGPSWLIALCGPEPQMTVQVALVANLTRFATGAPVEFDPYLSTAFSGHGVPLNWPDALPISAERAVRFAYDQLGARVAEVPELYVRGGLNLDGIYDLQAGSARNCNRWRIVLDRDVAVKSGPAQAVRLTREVFVSSLTCAGTDVAPLLQVPVAGQASAVRVRYVDFSISPPREYLITVASVSPIRFELTQRVPAS